MPEIDPLVMSAFEIAEAAHELLCHGAHDDSCAAVEQQIAQLALPHLRKAAGQQP